MSVGRPHRIDHTAGFVLHSYPFRETSLIIESWTAEHGRVALVARGARRPRSALRGLLQPFTPLLLSWSGKQELRTLHTAQWQGGLRQPQGMALLCGFYINELVLKLLARDDPHPGLFVPYQSTLHDLAGAATDVTQCAIILRRFEQQLLAELGYAQPFTHEAEHGEVIQAELSYHYQCDRGALLSDDFAPTQGLRVFGKTLLDLARHDYSDTVSLTQGKQLMRHIINHHLNGQTLFARELLKDLQQL
jgi:DNA repair protein RecO (recombination protein O)